jgi:hypothetical protein
LACRAGSGGHLQTELEEADYKSKIYEAARSGFCPAGSLEQRVLALCRLLKIKGLAQPPGNIKGQHAIASN